MILRKPLLLFLAAGFGLRGERPHDVLSAVRAAAVSFWLF